MQTEMQWIINFKKRCSIKTQNLMFQCLMEGDSQSYLNFQKMDNF